MTDEPRAPVLVTGSHRSGSTWVGRMLASADELHYVQEPFNIVDRQHWLHPRPPRQFFYIDEHNEADWLQPMQRVLDLRYPLTAHLRTRPPLRVARRMTRIALDAKLARRRGAAALLKDPIAVFSTPWLVQRFEVVPVVLVRDPVAFVGSLVARGWTFDFRHWLDQPRLMHDHLDHLGSLGRVGSEIRDMVDEPGDIIDQGVLQWNAIYGFVDVLRHRLPDSIVLSYEDIASNPPVEVEALFGRLGLRFGERQAATVRELSTGSGSSDSGRGADGEGTSAIDVRRDSSAALTTWKRRLTGGDIERIRRGTDELRIRLEHPLGA